MVYQYITQTLQDGKYALAVGNDGIRVVMEIKNYSDNQQWEIKENSICCKHKELVITSVKYDNNNGVQVKTPIQSENQTWTYNKDKKTITNPLKKALTVDYNMTPGEDQSVKATMNEELPEKMFELEEVE